MSAELEPQSRVLRWFDTFLQEQNIRWILGLGMLILLGSSLMLVTSQWESYTSNWRLGILLGYTAGVHAVGQIAYRSLGLRKTGTGLMALTVMLIPLSFHALRWMHPQDVLSTTTLWEHGFVWLALIADTIFATFAAKRLFDHFLRGTQPTFVAAYVLLCVAGCIVPALPTSWAPATALMLWGVFAMGATKVNRHVFWLTVEHRLPRIFGFFPIALLGSQFLTLFAISLAPHVPLTWIGVGVVLTAIPILLTADALARVFLEVEGRLTRPLPWSIVLPMFVGLVLSATGVCVAATTFPQAQALVPAAALSAQTMSVVARRTERRGFVWALLIAITLAYQSTPSFFRDVALQVIQHGAAAVHETRLPIAFYGLTYLPLLAILSGWAALRRNAHDELFAPVVRQFVTALGSCLLVASCSHPKAMFPVGLALAGLFITQAFLFRQRFSVVLAMAAWLVAAAGTVPFLATVCGLNAPAETTLLVWASAAAVLLWPGRWIDRQAQQWRPAELRAGSFSWCETTSFGVALITSAYWIMDTPTMTSWGMAAISGALLGGLFIAYACIHRQEFFGAVAICFVVAYPSALALGAGWSQVSAITLATGVCAGLWAIGMNIKRNLASTALQPFVKPAESISECGLTVATLLIAWPLLIGNLVFDVPFSAGWLVGMTSLWTLECAARRRRNWSCLLAWLSVMLVAGVLAISQFGPAARSWLPALWSCQAVLGVALVRPVTLRSATTEDESDQAGNSAVRSDDVTPWLGCVFLTLASAACLSLFVFLLPLRVTGGIALVGLLLLV